jgi:hypothetical protein
MAVKYHINEVDIFKFITDIFNNNSSGGKIEYSIGYYFLDEDGNNGGFVKRFTQKGGRFDIKQTFDDDTYLLKNESFVPMAISNLNASYLAHDKIKEITYEPNIEFLIYIENDITYKVIELVMQEIRAKLIQYQTTLDVEFLNLEGGANITETLKVIAMAGEIDYGQIVRIQGRSYLSISMPLTLEVTNYGEYTNQETIYLSVPSVSSGAEIEMYPISWNYGVGIDVEGSQVLNDKSILNLDRAKQIRHVPKTTAFGFSMAVQIDFNNPILKKIYLDSRKPTQATSTEIWKVKSTMSVLDTEATPKVYVVDTDLTLEDEFILDKKTPVDELSKGEKIIYALTFLPAWQV